MDSRSYIFNLGKHYNFSPEKGIQRQPIKCINKSYYNVKKAEISQIYDFMNSDLKLFESQSKVSESNNPQISNMKNNTTETSPILRKQYPQLYEPNKFWFSERTTKVIIWEVLNLDHDQ